MSNIREKNKKTKIYTNKTMQKLKKQNKKQLKTEQKKNKIKNGKMWLWSGLVERYHIDCNN